MHTYVWDRKSSSQGWVRFLTENLQYWTFNSIFWDLWGGVLPDALTYIHTSLAYIHTYKLRNQKPSTGRGLLKNPPQGEGFWNIEHVCMYVCWACMYVCILNYRPRGWVQFLTKNVQYLNDNSIFWDLWGGVLPDALTYIHPSIACIHT